MDRTITARIHRYRSRLRESGRRMRVEVSVHPDDADTVRRLAQHLNEERRNRAQPISSGAVNKETVNDRAKLIHHRLVARRLLRDPALVEDARAVLENWARQHPKAQWVKDWRQLLDLPMHLLRQHITGRDEHAVELRLSSPFAVVEKVQISDLETRRRLWRKARLGTSGVSKTSIRLRAP